ncbi:hypothetical protein CR513_54006, partial [Mucuna pruriens]
MKKRLLHDRRIQLLLSGDALQIEEHKSHISKIDGKEVYVDDMVVKSISHEQHIKDLEEIFT